MDDEIGFQCCFCGLRIEESPPDPCELIVVSDFGKPEVKRRTQAVYCHAGCLRQHTDPSIPWDALDDD